jgi:YHS domain-containing protein
MMKSCRETVKDPVCQMLVPPDQYAVNYLGMDVAFCSQQCKDRFLANPHLYIGDPARGRPSRQVRK